MHAPGASCFKGNIAMNLKKFLLICLLALPCAYVHAEWTKLRTYGTEDDYNQRTQYVDFGTLKHKDGTVTIRDLSDYSSIQRSMPFGGYPYLSVVKLYELDCKGGRYRVLVTMWFSENMGLGGVINSYDIPTNFTALSDSDYIYEQTLWNAACHRGSEMAPASGVAPRQP